MHGGPIYLGNYINDMQWYEAPIHVVDQEKSSTCKEYKSNH